VPKALSEDDNASPQVGTYSNAIPENSYCSNEPATPESHGNVPVACGLRRYPASLGYPVLEPGPQIWNPVEDWMSPMYSRCLMWKHWSVPCM